MKLLVFGVIMMTSLALAYYARIKRRHDTLSEFFVAERSFASLLFFFLAVGEIYSIGTLVGFPGGIYAGGATYAVWFMGYILLAYPIGYFINPLIWRAGKQYQSETGPDLLQSHFNSKGLGILAAISGLVFIIPWGQLQFAGLEVVLHAFKVSLSPMMTLSLAGLLALIYIVLSGMRAVAMVAVLKDIFMILGIIIIGSAAWFAAHGAGAIFTQLIVSRKAAVVVPAHAVPFVLSTIVFQAMGFYASPFGLQYVFTARSSRAVAKAQVFMPLYMLMYVFLIIAAFFAVLHIPGLAKAPDLAIIMASAHLLPGWLQGVVVAGAALSAIVVLTGLSLTVSAIVSKNVLRQLIKPGASEQQIKRWAQVVVGVYLGISLLLTVLAPHLMLNLINTAYYGFTQFFPAILAVLFWPRATAIGVGTGLIVGDIIALSLYFAHVLPWGLNLGLIALLGNFIVTVGVSLLTRAQQAKKEVVA
ncbi:sodium:solute symporter family protein [Sulfobacillus thermosulfidooxidans]|uniref:sodium:solute symporter family protein n=1 Tax=Sulfobacillus thermosulfidooxidans TaxID=28034 RepID=UPI0006B5C484|nr:sodium:solute symporter family protein [Sulfobacillus thermosulfidooxidans]